MKIIFTKLEYESKIYQESGGTLRKVIFKSAVYHSIIIYCRIQMFNNANAWQASSEDYSIDKKIWYNNIIEIIREIKKMGH